MRADGDISLVAARTVFRSLACASGATILARRAGVSMVVVFVTVGALSNAGASASASRSSTASTKYWTVTLRVSRTSTVAGTTIPATVTVDNRSGHRVEVTGCTGTDYEILVGNAKVPHSPIIPTVLCTSWMGAGVHVFHTKVQTMYESCGGQGVPRCGTPPAMSPLPTGTYRTELVLPTSKYPLPTPHPLTIQLIRR